MKFKPYIGKEDDFQIAVAKYLDTRIPHVLWCHVPNESKAKVQYRAKQRAKGLKSGVPDILIFDHKLAIELKVGRNRISVPQANWLASLKRLGWNTFVTYSLDEAIYLIDKYCGIKK